MTTTVAPSTDRPATRPSIRVCTYVALPFDTVVGRLAPSDLADAAAATFGDHLRADPRADRPVVTARGVATARVWWTPTGAPAERCSARLTLLEVQGGRDAVTELLVEVPATCVVGAAGAATAHRFLRQLDLALARAVAA